MKVRHIKRRAARWTMRPAHPWRSRWRESREARRIMEWHWRRIGLAIDRLAKGKAA